MHELIVDIGLITLIVLAALIFILIARARKAVVRIILTEVLTVMITGALILQSISEATPYYAVAALALALLSFVATLAAARFLATGKVF